MRGKELILIRKINANIIVWLVPFVFGLWSLILGQDRNFDLAGYHLYNGFSFLNNKFDLDFAVSGIQTYFNPLLDAAYFSLNTYLNPKLVGLMIGLFHGLIFVLIFKITSIFLIKNEKINFFKSPHLKILLVSIAGCLTPNFLSSLGNSMGDNTTAVLNLFSLFLILKNFDSNNSSNYKILAFFTAGLIIGCSVGLKLTNAPYALSMAFSLFFYPEKFPKRIVSFLLFSLSVLCGIFLTGGFWFIKMWEHFNNPFFPLFSNFFHNNFSNISTLTNAWTPKDFFSIIFFPFFKLFNYNTANDSLAREILWPIIYVLLILKATSMIKNKLHINFSFKLSKENFLICFIVFSYILWMFIFGLQRYLVTIEVLTPLAFLILIKSFNFKLKEKFFRSVIILSIIISLFGGFGTFGHTRWVNPAFYAEIPLELRELKESLVLMSDNSPISWLVTLFPKDLSFFRLNTFSDEQLILDSYLSGKKHFYVIFSGIYNWRIDNVKKWDHALSLINLKSSLSKCHSLDLFIKKIKFRGKIKFFQKNQEMCYLDIMDKDYVDSRAVNDEVIKLNQISLQKYNLNLDTHSCKNYSARLGTQNWNYIWCKATK